MPDFERSNDYRPAYSQGDFRFPPGLRHSLPFYTRRSWVKFGHPIPLFEHLHQTFGSIAQYRFMGTTIVFVNDPEYVQEILVNQAQSFVRERTIKRMKILLGEGLITSDDPIHMRQRKLIAPAFHRQRIAGYADEIVKAAEGVASSWREGQEIDAGDAMMRLSLRIVARTLFDSEVDADVLSVADEANTVMGLYNFLVAFPKLEQVLHWPIPGVVKFRRAKQRLDDIVDKLIANRRALSAEQLEGRGDLLSMLVAAHYEGEDGEEEDGSSATGMSDAQVRDEVLTIFLAGYETVANALTWTLYLLSQNPEARDRMFAEVDELLGNTGAARDRMRPAALADYPQLKYTEMVFAEAMRLYPPAWAMGRQSTAPVTLGEYRLPAGAHFFISQYILHRSEEYWDEPLAFRPERHTPEAKAARPRYVYFPFGAGRRHCIGESFAWMEGVLALATIAQRWRLEFVPRFPVEAQAKITLRPKFPMSMRTVAR
ncbi:Cytochrome P450 [Bryocella elongata]|uniref:Cytochrome P450 n=1 Tax=Bryocella elongata TaxID=863522 RepID=A0A1H5TUF5_9BACT|nr:cytochrome P450 [Bryocella elongata]SEF66416.1 Cytochrome P450 [Bryocella elongata]